MVHNMVTHNLFDDMDLNHKGTRPSITPPRVTRGASADPLALVCYWKKLNLVELLYGEDHPSIIWALCRFLDSATFSETAGQLEMSLGNPSMDLEHFEPDEESITEANEIREYYHLKMSTRAFMEERGLSPFYVRLHDFFNLHNGNILETDFGLVAGLPDMYKEDLEYDWLEENSTSFNQDPRLSPLHHSGLMQFDNLKYIMRTVKRSHNGKTYLFWFWNEAKQLHCISVAPRNILMGFINRAVKSGNDLTFIGRTKVKSMFPNSKCMVKFFADNDFEVL